MRKYDGLYIFAGQAKDDVLAGMIDKALAEVTRLGGNVLAQEVIGKPKDAYPMHKCDRGVYVLARFERGLPRPDPGRGRAPRGSARQASRGGRAARGGEGPGRGGGCSGG